MDNRIYMGIDPGKKSGAICIWRCPSPFTQEDSVFDFIDWPKDDNPLTLIHLLNEYARNNGGGWKDFRELVERENPFCVIEKVSSKTGQGVRSMFSFGKNFGMWLMLLSLYEISHRLLTPVAWRTNLVTKTDGPDTKKSAYTVACRLFPKIVYRLRGPRGGIKDGRVDALLMAYKARLIETGGK